ncbi:MAG: ATP-binding protein [Desulfobacterales bacterium]|nr:ATP-binding protein [Desulfobacterales bacterium]
MNKLRIKLFVPTVLVVAFCLGVIVYISYQQYSSFQASSAQTTLQLEHEVQSRLLAVQTNNRGLVDFLANNWSFIDSVALGTSTELLDQVVPFTVYKSVDFINVYDTDGVLLACAENPGRFGARDDISPLLGGMKSDSDIHPAALVHGGKLALVALKRIEGNYGPIGFLVVGRYLTRSTLAEFNYLYHDHQAALHFYYQGREYLTLGGKPETDASLRQKSTFITFLPEIDKAGLLSVLLTEDVSRTERDFWRQFFVITLVFSFVSLVVIVFSRKITMRVTTDLEKSRDELELRVRERTEELRGSEERFRTLLNSLDSLVYVADMDTYELLFINEYGQKIWGNVVGKTCWQALQAGQTGPCEFCTNAKLLDDKGEPRGVHVWELQNTVDNEWYECRDQAIRWPDGHYVRMEIATNITQRKQAEMALAQEKERLAVTLRSIGDGVITTDTHSRVVLINKVAERLTGWSSADAVGRPLAEVFNIINERTRQPCENPVEKVMVTGGIIGLANHTALISRDGREISIADSGAPIRDRESKIIGVVLVFRDITAQLRMEQELIKIKKLESIGILAGGIAHDFNNILAAILGNIELAGMSIDPTSKAYPLLQGAKQASLRAKDLTQQLLTFSKGGDPVKKTTSIGKVITESANFVLHGSPVFCRLSIPDDLWLVDIDAGQISQVIQNLVMNAKHAMPDGGEISITCANITDIGSETPLSLPGKAYIKITVQDNGCGIAEKYLEKIFDPYFTTKQEGSGLGLSISHSIINKHNGHIAVQSRMGKGSTFSIYLPASEQQAVRDQDQEADKPADVVRAKVLIMDDEQLVQDIAGQMLVILGHEVLHAADGREAIEIFTGQRQSGKPVDVIIMDLTIPGGMGGKEAIGEILKIDPRAKVIVSSGYGNDPVMANYRQYGFKAAIAKPFLLEELNKTLTDVLS